MDKTCSIVQDLLPLYEEDMLREETKEFVDGHLAQCAACRAELDALKADVKPAPVSAQPLRDLKRQLRRKKLTAVLLAVTLALTLATAGFAYLTAPQYLPYSETEWAISRSPRALADGSAADGLSDLSGAESISVSLLVPVSGAEVTNTQDPNSGKTIYFITAWRTPLDTWRGAFDETGGAPLFTLDAANCAAVCYSQNNGQDDVLLCGSMNGGIISLPRLALGYYVLLSLALLITLGIAFFVCRRKKTGKALGYLALIPASYLVKQRGRDANASLPLLAQREGFEPS